mmetsp:Transcript_60328/g.168549  ORF Transcript_60328/g.168549 Transcript_60328/m.168549 type:complete len:492 (-) Transcript_60328:224-1699(-)
MEPMLRPRPRSHTEGLALPLPYPVTVAGARRRTTVPADSQRISEAVPHAAGDIRVRSCASTGHTSIWGEATATDTRTADSAKAVSQLDRDLPRTHPHDRLVQSRRDMIRGILMRHIEEDIELNYCQGMNLVAVAFAGVYFEADEAYKHFSAFVSRVRGLWLPGFPLIEQGTSHFAVLAVTRPWFRHLQTHHIDPSMYLPNMWMALFGTWLPLPTLLHFVPLFEREGFSSMLAMTLAVLDHVGARLLQLHGQEELLLAFAPTRLNDFHGLIPEAHVLAKSVMAWLPVCGAETERAGDDQILGPPKYPRRVDCIANADDGEVVDEGLFGGLADFARKAADGAGLAARETLVAAGAGLAKQCVAAEEGLAKAQAAARADIERLKLATGRDLFQPWSGAHIFRGARKKTRPDGPGLYVITHSASVRVGDQAGLENTEVAMIRTGKRVRVLEVLRIEAAQRVRARIDTPAGWISLEDTSDGYRWAKLVERKCSQTL